MKTIKDEKLFFFLKMLECLLKSVYLPLAFWVTRAAGVKISLILQQHLNLYKSWDEELTIDVHDGST